MSVWGERKCPRICKMSGRSIATVSTEGAVRGLLSKINLGTPKLFTGCGP